MTSIRLPVAALIMMLLPSVARAQQPHMPHFSFSVGPAWQSFSPDGSVWNDEKFTEPIVFSTGHATYGAFTLSGGGRLSDRWGLFFDVDARIAGQTKAGNALVGLSAVRLIADRFRVQAGAAFGVLLAQDSIVIKSGDDSDDGDVWQGGAGVYGAAIYDVARFGDLSLNLHARFSAAAYEIVTIKSMSAQLGVAW